MWVEKTENSYEIKAHTPMTTLWCTHSRASEFRNQQINKIWNIKATKWCQKYNTGQTYENCSAKTCVLLHCRHVSMATQCLAMGARSQIWTFALTCIYWAYTLFHFLASLRNTLHSACLSLRLPRCRGLVSWQVLRPIKLSASLVDLKDTNTQSALTQTHSCTMEDRDNSNMHSDFTPTHAER